MSFIICGDTIRKRSSNVQLKLATGPEEVKEVRNSGMLVHVCNPITQEACLKIKQKSKTAKNRDSGENMSSC